MVHSSQRRVRPGRGVKNLHICENDPACFSSWYLLIETRSYSLPTNSVSLDSKYSGDSLESFSVYLSSLPRFFGIGYWLNFRPNIITAMNTPIVAS
jgi:hypothetical protein